MGCMENKRGTDESVPQKLLLLDICVELTRDLYFSPTMLS